MRPANQTLGNPAVVDWCGLIQFSNIKTMDDGDVADNLFQAATDHLPSIMKKVSNDDLLYLYARFKQATVGPCKNPKPGLFDYQARKKWYAWKDLGSMSEAQAKNEYVWKMQYCDPQWDGKLVKKSVSGRCISRPVHECNEDTDSDECEIFRICKDGDLTKLEKFPKSDFKVCDSDNRTLLHWASDRGHCHVVSFLLENNCDVNAVDNELLTPLHYASFCGYKDIVQVLLKNGADPTLSDESGDTPWDCAELQDIKELLNSVKNGL